MLKPNLLLMFMVLAAAGVSYIVQASSSQRWLALLLCTQMAAVDTAALSCDTPVYAPAG